MGMLPGGTARRQPRRGAAGFTLFELMVAMAIAVIVIVGSYSAFIGFNQLRVQTKSKSKAMQAARAKIEEMQALGNIQDVFATYNTTAMLNFDVTGLNVRDDDADGKAGRIIFPVGGDNTIWENIDDPSLEMPADLNLNGDMEDSVDDYLLLPVGIQIEWEDASGDNQYFVFIHLRSTQ